MDSTCIVLVFVLCVKGTPVPGGTAMNPYDPYPILPDICDVCMSRPAVVDAPQPCGGGRIIQYCAPCAEDRDERVQNARVWRGVLFARVRARACGREVVA